MNWRQVRAGLLALVYLLGLLNVQAAAQTQEPIWREVSKVTFGDLHRRPPSVPLPPVDPAEVARWRTEIVGAVQAVPKETFWNSVKAGGTQIIRNPLNLVKGGARLVGQGAVFQLGVVGVNAALQAFYNQVKADANPTTSDLYRCLSNSTAAGYGINTGAVCEVRYNSSAMLWVVGPTPEIGQTVYWNDVTVDGGRFYTRVTAYNGGGEARYDVYSSACGGFSTNTPYIVNVQAMPDYWNQHCPMPSGNVPDPIYLQDYIEGNTDKGIPPHPEMKDEIKNAVVQYITNNPPQPGPQGQIYPGMTLSPAPSASGWYGVPISIYDDEDGDGWSDWEEILRESDPNDPNSRPDPKRDTDGDGAPDEIEDAQGTDPYDPASKPDPKFYEDLDQDGIPDAEDPDQDGDGVPDETDPAPRDKTIPIQCMAGYVPDAAGTSCVPKEDAEKCPAGTALDAETGKCLPKEDDPVTDKCGDFDPKRFLAHTAHYLRDLIVPCEPKDIFKPVMDAASKKFPFALVASLGSPVNVGQPGNQAAVLPTKWGPLDLPDWTWIAPLLFTISLLFKGYFSWMAIDWVIGRMSPQLVIK
jgi:hypothetical protein